VKLIKEKEKKNAELMQWWRDKRWRM